MAMATPSNTAKEIIVFNMKDGYMHSSKPSTKEWMKKQAYCVYSGVWGERFTTLLLGQHIYSMHRKKILKLKYSDPRAKWIRVKNMREDHGDKPPSAVLNGSIHVCGSSDKVSQSVERFEESENKLIALPPYQVARKYHCIVATKDHIYCIGGKNAKLENILSVERFDGKRWEFVKEALRELINTSATVLGEKIFVADRIGVVCYNIQTDSWHELNLSSKWPFNNRYFVKILNVDDELYLIGRAKSKVYNEIHHLNPETEEMTLIEEINAMVIPTENCLAV